MQTASLAAQFEQAHLPFVHIGGKVDLRITDRVLEAYRGTERLTSHLLLPEGSAGNWRTNDADLPAGDRYQPWDADRVREWAGRIGPAAVTVIVAYDEDFPESLPELFPFADARSWYAGQPALITENALRNSSLQAGYLILAARALGLDCGPMSGFDGKALDAAFFAGTSWKSNLLINLGYGDASKLRDRLPRLPFDRACVLA